MLTYPNIDPVIFSLGPLQVRWYGLMYVLGFIASMLLVRFQINQRKCRTLAAHYENLNLVLIICLVVGARLGYVLFYNLPYYLEHPAELAATWMGGMSFHGGLIAMVIGGVVFCRVKKLDFWQTADIYVVTFPIGLGLGRFGNFLNAELYGRVADVPWAMVFPGGGSFPRHPSQLYEMLLEGVLLFTILWNIRKKTPAPAGLPAGAMLAIFLLLYGTFRTVVELFREPDPQLGFILGPLTMGQVLSLSMVAIGGLLLILRRNAAGKNT